jgi:ABC-type branched-subunit amino acid transport system substrate-binding protein
VLLLSAFLSALRQGASPEDWPMGLRRLAGAAACACVLLCAWASLAAALFDVTGNLTVLYAYPQEPDPGSEVHPLPRHTRPPPPLDLTVRVCVAVSRLVQWLEECRSAAQLAELEINANRSRVFGGANVTLRVLIGDTRGVKSGALASLLDARKLTTDPIAAVVGPAFSSECEALSIFASLSNTLIASPSATSSALVDKSEYPLLVRTIPPDTSSAESLIAIMQAFGWRHCAILYVTGTLGEGNTKYFSALAAERGIRIHAVASYESGAPTADQAVLTQPLATIHTSGARIVVLFADGVDAVPLRLAIDAAGMIGRGMVWLTTQVCAHTPRTPSPPPIPVQLLI